MRCASKSRGARVPNASVGGGSGQRRARPRTLVGLLTVGEPTTIAALESATSQAGFDVDTFVIRNLPKREAHAVLYERFNTSGSGYDLLVKLDADMLIVEPHLFGVLVQMLAEFDALDHVKLAVTDWFTGTCMTGLHAWRPTVRWLGPPPPDFTDRGRTTSRGKSPLLGRDRRLVLHGFDPDATQAVRFGAHRGLKSTLLGSGRLDERLSTLAEAAEADPHPMRLLATAAALIALEDPGFGRHCTETSGGIDRAVLARLAPLATADVGPRMLREAVARHDAGRAPAPSVGVRPRGTQQILAHLLPRLNPDAATRRPSALPPKGWEPIAPGDLEGHFAKLLDELPPHPIRSSA